MTDLEFECDGVAVRCEVDTGVSLLDVLRERLGRTAVKDGCAPQGQCGCCTVLVDGEPRVACVTPAARVAGRRVTTVDGLDPDVRDRLAGALCATGGAQCGFCTPGIVTRLAPLLARGRTDRTAVDRALAAHLCRCTGWQTILEAVDLAAHGDGIDPGRDLGAAAARAALESDGPQAVGIDVALGRGGFADDAAPSDALVAVPRPPGSTAPCEVAAGLELVVAPSLHEARLAAGKTQGRRTTRKAEPPFALPPAPLGGAAWATGWVEPAYLEPDASWCAPGGTPSSPLANGGAFGGKVSSPAPQAARELADRLGRPVRVVFAREDVVRLGPKRPPLAGTAWLDGTTVHLDVVSAGPIDVVDLAPYGLVVDAHVDVRPIPGPPVGRLRAPFAETAVLAEAALTAVGFDRAAALRDERAAVVLLDTCVAGPGGAVAGAAITRSAAGAPIDGIRVRVAAGDPLDPVVLRSYCIGAAHMALGWLTSEAITVDPETGEVHDLTIRSFGIVRPKDMPPVTIEIVDDPRPACPRAGDAVFAAVAAAIHLATSS